MKSLLLVLCFLAMLLSVGNADILHVPGDYPTIQEALVFASTGDTILVAPGTYYEHIDWPSTQGINLLSEYGADSTVIDAFGTLRVLTINTNVDTTTVISGFTIKNGSADYGGGIYCEGTSPTISNNIITNNSALGGGGIYCIGGSPIISQNEIIDNTASGAGMYSGGAGINCWFSDPKIIGNIIENNLENGRSGGGIRATGAEELEITGNTVIGNSSDLGGAMDFYKTIATINYNTIANNTAEGSGDGMHFYQAEGYVNYNNIFGNGCGMHSEFLGGAIDAENNWWGDSTGPYHGSNPGGLGDTVSDYIDFDPWLFAPWGIEEHQTLRIKSQTPIIKVFPNPFSKLTYISFGKVQGAKSIELKIYNATGRLVRQWDYSTIRLSDKISWYGCDDSNRKLPSGVYFLKFQAGDYEETGQLLLIR